MKKYEYGDWTTIIDMFEKAYNLPIRPDPKKFKWYPASHIFDEDKSVKWNILEASKRNEEYEAEFVRLKDIRSEAINNAKEILINMIADYTYNTLHIFKDYDSAYNGAKVTYGMAYEEKHSDGIRDIICEVERLVEYLEKVNKLK